MARLRIQFTDDIVKLVRNLRFGPIQAKFFVYPRHESVEVEEVDNGRYNVITRTVSGEEEISPIEVVNSQDVGDNLYGIDTYDLWGGTYIFEDMAYILGKMDRVIEGTLEDPDGPKFDEETTEYLHGLASFIIDNLSNIEEILHQFCTEGIRTDVVYTCKPNEHIWKIEEK